MHERLRRGLGARHTGGSLMERLQADDEGETLDAYGEDGEIRARVASIKRNMMRILNARMGCAPSAPGLGLSDFNDSAMGSTDMMRHVASEIRACVERYEPRVSGVRVSFARDAQQGDMLAFTITAQTMIDRRRDQVVIDMALSGGRRFSLR